MRPSTQCTQHLCDEMILIGIVANYCISAIYIIIVVHVHTHTCSTYMYKRHPG